MNDMVFGPGSSGGVSCCEACGKPHNFYYDPSGHRCKDRNIFEHQIYLLENIINNIRLTVKEREDIISHITKIKKIIKKTKIINYLDKRESLPTNIQKKIKFIIKNYENERLKELEGGDLSNLVNELNKKK